MLARVEFGFLVRSRNAVRWHGPIWTLLRAVFRSKGEEYKPYLARSQGALRAIDGNSLTSFWEFRVKNWGQSRRHHHHFPHHLLFWPHFAHHKSSACSQRSTWNHVCLSSRSITQQTTTCFLLRLLPITFVVRDTRVPKLSLRKTWSYNPATTHWFATSRVMNCKRTSSVSQPVLRLSSMIHTVFHILYVLSCLKNTLVVTLLEFSKLFAPTYYIRWGFRLEQPSWNSLSATWCRRDSSWRPINGSNCLRITNDTSSSNNLSWNLGYPACTPSATWCPEEETRDLVRSIPTEEASPSGLSGISSVHLSRFLPVALLFSWQPKWVSHATRRALPLTLHRPMWSGKVMSRHLHGIECSSCA